MDNKTAITTTQKIPEFLLAKLGMARIAKRKKNCKPLLGESNLRIASSIS